MTSALTKYQVNIERKEDEGIESYAWDRDHTIFWTDSYNFHLVSNSGSTVKQGKLEEVLPNDALPLTQIHCNWFCKMDSLTKMLYVSFTDKNVADLKTVDLATGATETFATGLTVPRAMFHNFCWLTYHADAAQLAFSTEDKCIYFNSIPKGASGLTGENVECINPNIFFATDNSLMIACNYKDPKVLECHYLHKEGKNSFKIVLKDETKITFQDFGELKENTFYFLGIEGEAGKSIIKPDRGHTVMVFILNMGGKNFATLQDVPEADLKAEFLDEAAPDTNVDMPDGFCLVNNQFSELCCTCSNNKFITWTFNDVNGELKPSKKGVGAERSAKSYYCSSFDRQSLWAYDVVGDNCLVEFHSKANRSIQYFYYLEKRTAGGQWAAADLKKMADLID